ncbi:MAG: GGDEF domain-containing protein [Deltaproteobacteria bacterium]|nr:GGDEF domain-containing protein [Deltaproteobacteria bacterium]
MLSLRSVLALATFGLLAMAIAGFTICIVEVRNADDQMAAAADHAEAQRDDAQALLTSMIDQEVGMRGFLASGAHELLEPYERGQVDEHDALVQLRRDLAGQLRAEVDALAAALDAWHQTIATPQIAAREKGPLPDLDHLLADGKQSFDRIRAAHSTVDAAVVKLGAQGRADALALRRRIFIGTALAALAILAVSLLGTLYLLRTVVHRAGQEQAVALSKFGEYVQQLTDEGELHEALERVAHDTAAPSKTHLMIRNASKNRLEVMRPEMSIEDQIKHPILTDPMKCRAVRTLREVTGNAGDATACSCELGVPAAGSYACMPMLAAGELVGVANFQSGDRDHFQPEHVRQLGGYLGFAGATISTLRLIQATRERALRDGLTGAYNRAFLAEYLSKSLATARRRKAPLSLLMADLDHFKKINDQHGHLAGDQAIVTFARVLQRETRSSDAVVRYGGEEFVVVLVDADATAARATAERIRGAVEQAVVKGNGIDLGPVLRTSIGVATFPDNADDDVALLAAADAAVYRAKGGGRNRVSFAKLSDTLGS